jgi:hypothetical protein
LLGVGDSCGKSTGSAVCWSERRDLNSRPPVPQTGALTGLRYAPMERKPVDARACCTYRFRPQNSIAPGGTERGRPDGGAHRRAEAGSGKTAVRPAPLPFARPPRPLKGSVNRGWRLIFGFSRPRKTTLDGRATTCVPDDAWCGSSCRGDHCNPDPETTFRNPRTTAAQLAFDQDCRLRRSPSWRRWRGPSAQQAPARWPP